MIKATKKDKYPCLMESIDNTDLVILMADDDKGMIVSGKGTTKYNTPGSYTGGWVMGHFKPYAGKIILENV